MSHEERSTISNLISGILINIYVIVKLKAMFADGRLAGEDAVQIWAQAMLWIIPISIALIIAITIVFNILHAIFTNTPKPSFLVDERDHAIQSMGMKITLIFLSIGFIGMVVALALGYPVLPTLIGLWFAMATGSLLGDFSKLLRYRGAF